MHYLSRLRTHMAGSGTRSLWLLHTPCLRVGVFLWICEKGLEMPHRLGNRHGRLQHDVIYMQPATASVDQRTADRRFGFDALGGCEWWCAGARPDSRARTSTQYHSSILTRLLSR